MFFYLSHVVKSILSSIVESPLLLVKKGSVKMALKIAADDFEEKRL